MHTLRVNVTDALFPQFISYLQQFSGNGVDFVEDVKPSFIVSNSSQIESSLNEAIKQASNGEVVEHDAFWENVDKHINSL